CAIGFRARAGIRSIEPLQKLRRNRSQLENQPVQRENRLGSQSVYRKNRAQPSERSAPAPIETGIPRDARARTVRLRRLKQPFAGTEPAVSGALQRSFNRRAVPVQYAGGENRCRGFIDSATICPAPPPLLFATG